MTNFTNSKSSETTLLPKRHMKNSSSNKKLNEKELNLDEEESDFEHQNKPFDLYKKASSILYVKQKYKMYLDWLNENCAPNSQSSQLNWYNYEQTFKQQNSNQSSKYLENLSNASASNQNQKTLASLVGSLNNNNNNNNNSNNSNNAILNATIQNNNNNRGLLRNNKNLTKEIKTEENLNLKTKSKYISLLNSSSDSSSSGIGSLSPSEMTSHNLDSSTSVLKSLKNVPSIDLSNADKKLNLVSKGVKFQSINKFNKINSYLNNISVYSPSQNLPIKPILKTSQSSSDYYYYGGSNGVKNSSVASIGSTSQISSSLSNNYLNRNITGSSPVKLPPIVKCSDDFYAVLNDLEKERIL